MPVEFVERAFGGRDGFDAEGLEKGPRPVGRLCQCPGHDVVGGIGIGRRQALLEAEQACEGMIQPEPRGGAAEQVVMRGKTPPDGTRIGLDRRPVAGRHTQILHAQPLSIEHAEDIVVRHDEQLGRIKEGLVFGIPARVGMAVGRDDRQAGDAVIEPAGDGPRGLGRGKQPVRMAETVLRPRQSQWRHHVPPIRPAHRPRAPCQHPVGRNLRSPARKSTHAPPPIRRLHLAPAGLA